LAKNFLHPQKYALPYTYASSLPPQNFAERHLQMRFVQQWKAAISGVVLSR